MVIFGIERKQKQQTPFVNMAGCERFQTFPMQSFLLPFLPFHYIFAFSSNTENVGVYHVCRCNYVSMESQLKCKASISSSKETPARFPEISPEPGK